MVTLSSSWLHNHLADPQTDPQVVILDCRFALADPNLGRQQYEAGHIPGSYYFDLNQDLSSPVGEHGGRHPLPDPQVLAAKFAAVGIHSGKTLVVVYDDGLAFAARCWWLLRYLGHGNVKVLDGGFRGWQAAGYGVTDQVPPSRVGNFVAQVRSPSIVDIATVKALKDLPNIALVDSRESDRYRGDREPIDPIAGHIPEAVNYPWQEILDPQGYLLPASQLQQHWAALNSSDQILVYCGSGVTACANLLALEAAGIFDAKLYAGSWSDWCSYL
jgi:thiosulfate/3-mercaptopyruvate sulfurtransferase